MFVLGRSGAAEQPKPKRAESLDQLPPPHPPGAVAARRRAGVVCFWVLNLVNFVLSYSLRGTLLRAEVAWECLGVEVHR